ncbi:MAG: hypothetical protein IKV26_05755 [Paludibacteraceae bacterium]|nr:hypothetical protein [Paludibacteraceae bacterium]
MKTLVNKIALLVVVFLSSFVCLRAATPENNSIVRFQSKNMKNEDVFAVVVGDKVEALTASDDSYNVANSLWLVKVNDYNTFTLQNIGTKKFLSFETRKGAVGRKDCEIYSLSVDDNFPVNLVVDTVGYCFFEADNIYTYLYIQYDPAEQEWRFYRNDGGGHKKEPKKESQSKGNGWLDEDYPPMTEEESMVVEGSEIDRVIGSGDFVLGGLVDSLIVANLPITPIVVGNLSTYPQFSFWKTSTIQLNINNKDWTPVSFPFDVECITADLDDVYYQDYSAAKRSKGKTGWETKKKFGLFKRGIAYNFATDVTDEITLEFQFAEENDTTYPIRLEDTFSSSLDETGGNEQDKNWYYIGNALFWEAKMNNAIEYACVYNGSGYEPIDLVDGDDLSPFSTFFVQYAGDYAMSRNQLEGSSSKMLIREKLITKKYSLRIDGEGSCYKTGIYLTEGAEAEGYVAGEDFLSFANKRGTGVEIYTYKDDVEYSFNKLPIENTTVSVGIYIGKAGRYTISLNNISGGAEILVLYDTYTQEIVYLSSGEEYVFDSEKGVFDDRFIISVSCVPDVTTDSSSLLLANMVVVNNEIRGLVEGDDFYIYDVMGHLVYLDVVNTDVVILPNLNSGIYILQSSKGCVKFMKK